MVSNCQIRWIVGILCLIAPAALLSTHLLTLEAGRPVKDRCPWTSLGSILLLALGITSGIIVIFGCRHEQDCEPDQKVKVSRPGARPSKAISIRVPFP